MWVDLLIVLAICGGIYRGWTSGFLQQFWATLGFFGGLLIGRWLEPHTIAWGHTADSRAVITLITFLGSAVIFLTLGEYAGMRFKHRLRNVHLNKLDNYFGSVLSVAAALFSLWILAALANNLPYNQIKSAVDGSKIISSLNSTLPPAPDIVSTIGKFIDPNGFPDVFIGNEPLPQSKVNLPDLGEFAEAVSETQDSVVRIKGQGCGGIVTGTGFVVGNGLVATNAHVVAGIKAPFVQDIDGSHRSTVVWFDPDLDFAVMRVPDLADVFPLSINPAKVEPATPAVVLGYPGGGDFKVDPAAVLSQIKAAGRDIYGGGHTLRDIYELHADIVPGNSGGPVINKDGEVIGVVFAESTTYENVGYALTTPKVISQINQASSRTAAVSTGQCAE